MNEFIFIFISWTERSRVVVLWSGALDFSGRQADGAARSRELGDIRRIPLELLVEKYAARGALEGSAPQPDMFLRYDDVHLSGTKCTTRQQMQRRTRIQYRVLTLRVRLHRIRLIRAFRCTPFQKFKFSNF